VRGVGSKGKKGTCGAKGARNARLKRYCQEAVAACATIAKLPTERTGLFVEKIVPGALLLKLVESFGKNGVGPVQGTWRRRTAKVPIPPEMSPSSNANGFRSLCKPKSLLEKEKSAWRQRKSRSGLRVGARKGGFRWG